MIYKLQVQRLEPNPNYKEEHKKYQSNQSNGYTYGAQIGPPIEYFEREALGTEISQEQFDAMRKAIIELF